LVLYSIDVFLLGFKRILMLVS